jgi:hypothetical protein
MAERITDKHLQGLCDRLNRLTGSPLVPYLKVGDKHVAQIGNYHLSYAYGGVALHRMHSAGGGVNEPLYTGHVSKRELCGRMHAFILGIESTKS